MRQAKNWGLYVFFTVILSSFLLVYAWGADSTIKTDSLKKTETGYLENISFEKLPGKERVRFSVSKYNEVIVEAGQGNQVVVRMEDIFVPEGLRRPLEETMLSNVIRVRAVQESEKERLCAVAIIDLKERSPYSLHREGLNVFIDFNVASLATAVETAPLASFQKPSGQTPTILQEEKLGNGKKIGGEAKMLLDVQDADIKSVFRLLAEQGNVSIVSGDDVKGNVTLHLKDVTWLQALDTILDIKELSKTIDGRVVKVMTMDKRDTEPLITRVHNVDYADAKKLTANLLELLPKDKSGKARGSVKVDEHSNSLIIQAARQDMTRLFPIIEKIDQPTSQILIKANIVETTKSMARDLGITWGGSYNPRVGDYDATVTPTIGFPAIPATGTAALLDLTFGTIGGNILELQLSALQKNGKLNILSSPSIMTMDNQVAYTENGEEIPIRTLDKEGIPTTTYIPATLRLEITPHVIDGKNMKMDIHVKKDEVDMTRKDDYGNPYIIKKETKTNLMVKDGETIVISGLTKQKKEESTSGLPWLKDIPILGWLAKGEQKSDSMEEVLIFITPNVLNPPEISGIQGGF
jgi:type IV pilus assembly protein PilQ